MSADDDDLVADQANHAQKRKSKHKSQQAVRHDGRGVMFLKVLFRRRGSIVLRTIPVALFSSSIAVILMIVERFTLVPESAMPILQHPIAVQMLAIVLGYVTVLRTNIAVGRYFEGMTNVQFFGSKWNDAYTQLCSFIRSSAKLHVIKGAGDNMMNELGELQIKLLHWFSLLHCLAINELQVTQLDVHEDMFLKRINIVPNAQPSHLSMLASSQGGNGNEDLKAPLRDREEALEKTTGLPMLTVIGEPSPEERYSLLKADNKVDLVHSWIIEAVSCASLEGRILTQPPILSRVYQELSNGMLGFNQAYKIALVQFPFAFAQMLTVFLVAFLFCCPIAVYVFTGGEFLTPGLTLFTVLGFWGIHEIAVEIENPFGVSVNHLPLVELHETLNETLMEVTQATCPKF